LAEAPAQQERRQFFRIHYHSPLQFKTYSPAIDKQPRLALSRNISQSGILFQTAANPPQISSILWMSLDMRTLQICREIEDRALIFDNGLLGKVVRVEDNDQESYDVGVCFLTRAEKDSRDVRRILDEIAETR
jgi:c-di-GMP-binding flagellar brake protein YcgR